MATTADGLTKDRKTAIEELRVSSGFSDLPRFPGAESVERLAKETRWAREETGATMSALRERLTTRHLTRFTMEKMREAAARPGGQTKILASFAGIVLLGAAAILLAPRFGRRSGFVRETRSVARR